MDAPPCVSFGAVPATPETANPEPRVEGEPLQVDVVVVSYNSEATLRGCVEPLAQVDGVRVTVVDNASPAGDPLATIADIPGVDAVRAPRNGGFAYGCNLGSRRASAPLLLFINPDARIDEASLRALAGALGSLPQFNLWVRTAPRGAGEFCWHIDLLPRLTTRAGFELGTGVDINVYPPEKAAADLREALG
jgi:glycosyltransferase involved in cell wall biosynthesis